MLLNKKHFWTILKNQQKFLIKSSYFSNNMPVAVSALRLPPLPTTRDLIKLYKLRALRQLSQNFLLEERLTNKIVKAAGDITNCAVLEVGPGPGSITRSILQKMPKKLIVVEKDPRFLPTLELLQEACSHEVEMVIDINDICSYNFEKGFEGTVKSDWHSVAPPIRLIGNLPFNVSTNLIIRWLHSISEQRDAWAFGRTPMTLTFQKEVAERIVAPVADSQRCRLSVMCQLWCHVSHKFTIPGRAFIPKPEVDVGVVTLRPRKEPLVKLPFQMVEKLLRQIFNMRQKSSRKGAERLFPPELRSELGQRLFRLADVDFTATPFRLTTEEYARLAYAYNAICEEYPEVVNFNDRAPKNDLVTKINDDVALT